jgi:hypothetical protein
MITEARRVEHGIRNNLNEVEVALRLARRERATRSPPGEIKCSFNARSGDDLPLQGTW